MTDDSIRREAKTAKRTNWVLRLALFLLLALALAGGAGWYAWTLRGETQAQAAELRDLRGGAVDAKVAASKHEVTATELAACKKQTESIASIEGNLEATKSELETLRTQREQSAKRLEAFRELTAKLKKMIDAGQLDVEVRDGRMIAKLPAEVLFPSGSAELSREGELAMMEVAVALRQLKDRKFMVVGHTDSRPLEAKPDARYRDNWELSTARAVTVTKFLIEARLDPTNLLAAGHAAFDPVGNNKTKAGRQENRRIEIVMLPNIEELPPMLEEESAKKEETPKKD